MLGQYDTGFNTLSSKFGEFKDFSSANTQSGDDLASQFGINANQQLSQQPMSYTPNIYIPDVSTLISAANKIDPLMQQAQAKFQETYGWNQDRLKQETEPYANSYNQQKSSLGQSISGLGNSFIQQAQQLYNPGMYDQSQYNSALSTEQNLSQRLRQGEQGVLSQLNEMFNSASTFANKAENAYNTEKANRLNERAAIQGQQQNDMIGSRVGQAEKNAAQQVSNRRQNTMLSFNPENQNLLSYLTRGY
jgi:hypothetical protein